MKRLLALALMAAMVGGAHAQIDWEAECSPNSLALFWDTEYQETNVDGMYATVPMYFVIVKPEFTGLRQVEASIMMGADSGMVQGQVLEANGMWLGSADNFRISWPAVGPNARPPLDVTEYPARIATFQVFLLTGGTISMGPYNPATHPGVPVVWDQDSIPHDAALPIHPDDIDENGFGIVATVNGDGVVATENTSLSSVKALFQ